MNSSTLNEPSSEIQKIDHQFRNLVFVWLLNKHALECLNWRLILVVVHSFYSPFVALMLVFGLRYIICLHLEWFECDSSSLMFFLLEFNIVNQVATHDAGWLTPCPSGGGGIGRQPDWISTCCTPISSARSSSKTVPHQEQHRSS